MKKRWLGVFGALTLGLVLAGCGGSSSSSSGSGGTFRVGTASGIDSINPYVAFNQDAYATFQYIYPALVQYDKTNKHFAPFYARSWKATDGGKTWTFHLTPNAKWSDGKPLTSEDAAWTINTDIKYASGGAANAAGLIAHIKNAEAPDPNTLVVHYKEAPGNVLGQFQQYFILPKHIWSQHLGNNGADLKTFPNNPPVVGSGPFTLVKYQKNEIALLKKNPTYWGTKPKIDEFGLRMFSSDDAMISALKSHEIDAINVVPATAIKTLKDAGFDVSDVPGLDQTDFIINSSPHKTQHLELQNPKVREAFDDAIDRKQIIDVVFLGTARPGYSIIPPETGAWSNPNLHPAKFDLAKANQILDSLGYKKGSDGIRVAQGHKMSYDVIAPTDVQSVPRTFQIIQADFNKIGVKLNMKALDSTTAFTQMSSPNNKYEGFDLALWDWTALIDPDFMLSVVTCGQLGGWSDTGMCDKSYDAMYSKQQLTPNQNARKTEVWKMQKYLYDKRPYLWLANDDSVSAVSPSWEGFVNTPQGPFNELNIIALTTVHKK
jgi:peptide/nickel transport system substrate-binding protein